MLTTNLRGSKNLAKAMVQKEKLDEEHNAL